MRIVYTRTKTIDINFLSIFINIILISLTGGLWIFWLLFKRLFIKPSRRYNDIIITFRR